jgi:hypothetical protein
MTFRDARKCFSEMLRLGRAAIRLAPAALLGATLAGLILTEFLYPPASYFWLRHPVTLDTTVDNLLHGSELGEAPVEVQPLAQGNSAKLKPTQTANPDRS